VVYQDVSAAAPRVPVVVRARSCRRVCARLLAKAHGDEAIYCDYRDRYRARATSLGFEGHMKWAQAMP
jgi:adenylate cyclase